LEFSLFIDISFAKYIPKPSSVNTTNNATLASKATYTPYPLTPKLVVNIGRIINGANILIRVAEILLAIFEITVLDNLINSQEKLINKDVV